jgi:hypothetical protein
MEARAVAVLDGSRGEPLADPELDLIHVVARERGARITNRRLALALAPLVLLVLLFTAAMVSLVA